MPTPNDLPSVSNVDFEHNYIFIHIPKTAGTSIAAGLGHTVRSHYTAGHYLKLVGPRFHEMYKFCIVRNPWDRFVSTYEYVRMPVSEHHNAADPQTGAGKHADYDLVSGISLVECARLLKRRGNPARSPLQGRHWIPQVSWIKGKADVKMVDFVGRFEALDAAIAEIERTIKIEIKLPFLNRSSRPAKHYREVMDQETIDLVAEHYADDIRMFDYSF